MLSFSGAGSEEEEVNADMTSPRYRSSSCTFFSVSTLDTHQRFGILARFLQWPTDLVSVHVINSCVESIHE